jgi:Squalene cyclase
MQRASAFVRDAGGLERARVFTKMWLALFGLWSWDDLPAMPPELIFLPPWFPLNIYDFACWARQTVAALTVTSAYRPVRPFPVTIDELRTGDPAATRHPVTDAWGKAFLSSTSCCISTNAAPCPPCAGARSSGWSAGSSSARRTTAAGAGSNRRGCGR